MRREFTRPAAVLALAGAAVVTLLTVITSLGGDVHRSVVLDQTEIGENEKEFPAAEQDWVEDAYHKAMPFRDPGHISREEIRLEVALRKDGLIDRGKEWSFQQPLWGKYQQVMADVSQRCLSLNDDWLCIPRT